MLELASRLQRTQSADKALQKMEKQGYSTAGLLDKFAKVGNQSDSITKKFLCREFAGASGVTTGYFGGQSKGGIC